MAKKSKEEKILEGIEQEREIIIKHLDKQYSAIIEKLEQHDDRFDRVEMAVLENSKIIKEMNIKIDKIERNLEKMGTHHERRIRKLEAKVGV
jgi:predicted secreted Zn-dependent protease